MKDVILHAFNWKYRDVINELSEIAESGFGAILIAPPLYTSPDVDSWWQRYQPKDYRVLLSYLGDKSDIEELLIKAHQKGIKIYADIVLNHMANEPRSAAEKLNFPGPKELEKYASNKALYATNKLYGDLSEGLFSQNDFNEQINIEDWNNRDDVQYHQLQDLPDLTDNDWVLQQQRDLFYALHSMGFDGFRFDAIKHLNERQIDNIADQPFLEHSFLFGEVLTTNKSEAELFLTPYLSETHISAYDFLLHDEMRKAFSPSGSLKLLIDPYFFGNALHWSRSVTFTVNHDLPLNEGFRSLMLDHQDEFLANVYIFGRDGGVPLVYSDNNESIHENSSGISHPEDHNRWFEIYKRDDIKAMIKFHNAVSGERMIMLYEQNDCIIFQRGNRGFVAINKSEQWEHVTIKVDKLKNTEIYRELIHDYEIQLKGEDSLSIAIAPRTAHMWLVDSFC